MPHVSMCVDGKSLSKWILETKSSYAKVSDDFYLLYAGIFKDTRGRTFATFRLCTSISETNVYVRFFVGKKGVKQKFEKFQAEFLSTYFNLYKKFKIIVPHVINLSDSKKNYLIEIRPAKQHDVFKMEGDFKKFLDSITIQDVS